MRIKITNKSSRYVSKKNITDEILKHIIILDLKQIKSVNIIFKNQYDYRYYPKDKPFGGFTAMYNNNIFTIHIADAFLDSKKRINYLIAHELYHAKQMIDKEIKIINHGKNLSYKNKVYGVSGYKSKVEDKLKTKKAIEAYSIKYFPWEKDAIYYGNLFGRWF